MNLLKNKNSINWQFLAAVFVLFLCFFPATSVYARELKADFMTILGTMEKNAPIIQRLIVAISYVIGFFFIIDAIMDLKKIGGSSAAHQQSISGPMVKLIVGLALLYLMGVTSIGTTLIWGKEGGLLKYPASSGDPYGEIKRGIVMLMRIMGYIAFVRGLVMLSKAANQGGQQAGYGKGFMYIIGGILSINIVKTMDVLSRSFGFGGLM